MAAQAVFSHLDMLLDVAETWAENAAEVIQTEMVRISPSPDYVENEFATGAMKKGWRREKTDLATWRIYNIEAHAGFADEGFTKKKGKASARGWTRRGGEDYTEQGVKNVMPELNAKYQQDIDDARG